MKTKLLIMAATLILALGGLSVVMGQDVDKIKFPPLNPIPTPEIETITLDNGIRLYLLEDHALPIFRVSLRVNGGSYLEPPEKIGLADICDEVMRTGGTTKWSGDELDEMLEGIGGSVSSSVGLVSSGGSVNLLSEYSDLGLEVLADVIRNPIFDQDKIDLAKVQIRSAISRRNDNVGGIARREFGKLIYGANSPYAFQIEYATLDAVSRDDLIQFHQMIFRPGNIQMAVWGDFDQKQVVTKIKELFGDWTAETLNLPKPPEIKYDYRSKVYLVDKPDAKQAYIRIGHIGGFVTDEDYAARIVMNSILGGSFGSRLTDNVRTRLGLAYTTYGRYGANYAYPGMFFAHASTGNENVIKTTREMIKQVKSMLTDLPTEVEMQKGKDGYLNSFVFNFDTKGEVINRLMNYDFWSLPRDFLQTTKNGIEEMTPEKVMAVAQSALRPDQMVILIVGNVAEFDEPVAALGLGEPELVDITIPTPTPALEFTITDSTLFEGKALMEMVVAAHGGKAAINAVRTVKMSGVITYTIQQRQLEIQFEELSQLPHYVSATMNMMGRTILNITGDNGGWTTGVDGKLMEKTEAELATENQTRDRNFINLLKYGLDGSYRIVYAGTDSVDDKAVENLVFLDENDELFCQLTIDGDNFRLLSRGYDGKTLIGEGAIVDLYLEFTEHDGVLLPTKSERRLNDEMIREMTYDTWEINPDIPAGAFGKPL